MALTTMRQKARDFLAIALLIRTVETKSVAKRFLQANELRKIEGMASLPPRRTGLPFSIWVSEEIYALGKHNRPRLKVLDREQEMSSSISIDDPIEILAGDEITGKEWSALVRYIRQNREPLMKLWNQEIDQGDYYIQQRPIQ